MTIVDINALILMNSAMPQPQTLSTEEPTFALEQHAHERRPALVWFH